MTNKFLSQRNETLLDMPLHRKIINMNNLNILVEHQDPNPCFSSYLILHPEPLHCDGADSQTDS